MLIFESTTAHPAAGRVKRGFTLVETLVGAVIFSAVITAVYSVLVMFLTWSRMSRAQIDLEANAQVAMARMVSEIADSDSATVVTSSSPPGIVFLSPRDAADRLQRDSAGAVVWTKWICYWLDVPSRRLMRVTVDIAPTRTLPSNPYTPASFSGQGSVIARNVSSLTVTGTTLVQLGATLAITVFNSDDVRMEITDSIKPRN